jgi:hypothetical protein
VDDFLLWRSFGIIFQVLDVDVQEMEGYLIKI